MLIRQYTPADRLQCIDIFNSNCPTYLDPSEINGLENWLNGLDKGEIVYKNSAADFFYVVEHNNTVIACGGFYIVKDKQQANMTWGMVNNLCHKQGYGKQLFQYRVIQIKKLFPTHSIVLDTSQHTYPFFERFGFTVTNIIPNAYGPGLDRYDMINTGQ
ncbi:MAG: GNAT family N-acetyltransferase [Bacteroidota bacterium]